MRPGQGDPGWVGGAVRLQKLGPDGAPSLVAVARLSLDGSAVTCDRPELLEQWAQKGIVGRASHGRLFPHDGQAFLDELPYMYKSAYFFAEPLA
jgi:hypothetical protein